MSNPGSFDHKVLIEASGMQVLFAFLDAEAIKSWWGARNAVIEPRPGGLLAVEWETGLGGQDEKLGHLGGILAGVLDRSQAGHFVHFGSLYWLTPRGETYGPTRLEIEVRSQGDPRQEPTILQVTGSGYRADSNWDRVFEIQKNSWEKTLQDLKAWCESQAPQQPEPRIMGLGDSYLAEAVLQRRRIS